MSAVLVLLVLLSLAGVPLRAAAASGTARQPSPGLVTDVPVLGAAQVMARGEPARGAGTVAVHGVRRIPGGTVVYWSVSAGPGGTEPVGLGDVLRVRGALTLPVTSVVARVVLIDAANGRAYAARETSGTPGGAYTLQAARSIAPDDARVFYVVMPELPAEVRDVEVWFAGAAVIGQVPVESGALEPAVDPTGGVPVGWGWPAVDQAELARAKDPAPSIFDLDVAVSTLDDSLTRRQGPGTVTVDLAADVLFAIDQATLTAQAGERIRQAAQAVNTGAKPGVVAITGHTDSTGSDAHNLDLSRRRAAAVAAALRPLVTVAGVTFRIEGKGETEPVAPNTTDRGRQLNRRVGVTFAQKGS